MENGSGGGGKQDSSPRKGTVDQTLETCKTGQLWSQAPTQSSVTGPRNTPKGASGDITVQKAKVLSELWKHILSLTPHQKKKKGEKRILRRFH